MCLFLSPLFILSETNAVIIWFILAQIIRKLPCSFAHSQVATATTAAITSTTVAVIATYYYYHYHYQHPCYCWHCSYIFYGLLLPELLLAASADVVVASAATFPSTVIFNSHLHRQHQHPHYLRCKSYHHHHFSNKLAICSLWHATSYG